MPPRDTADADLGAPYQVVADQRLPAALRDLGYEQTAGNRFERTHDHTAGSLRLAIDVLAPAYDLRLRTNQTHGDLVVDEIPGLPLALARPPVVVAVDVRLTTTDTVTARLLLPDPLSALCMKAAAWNGRHANRDAIDIWRLLETAYTAGQRAATWPLRGAGLDAARVLHTHFADPATDPFRTADVPPNTATRVRALVAAVVASPSLR